MVNMHGWDRLTSVCGLGCKMFLSPWAPVDKPYDAVEKDDVDDGTSSQSPITSEPQKPVWSDMSISAPIVRNKSSAGLATSRASISNGYEKVSSKVASKESSPKPVPKVTEKRNSVADLNVSTASSKALIKEPRDLAGSRTSLADDKREVMQMVTTV
ncbi:uncharacterized protein LOC128219636 isoform X1 [Mya arenaria]|uniref:uncharacterized protein LOC128219636 isoform X1 n=1 Tax=Mya arenaria TaxID=6604 RepID=UPI0022E585F0|nr:uncharacterized protein LOC128219636 isoform X1 [Mya arenaria]